MAGNDGLVEVWLRGAVVVSCREEEVGLAAYASVDVNCPPKVLAVADWAF